MVTTTKFTRADYMTLPEGYPAELLDGMLVKSPSPTWGHQQIVGDLHHTLRGLVGRDRVVMSPIDVFVDEFNVLQPDVLVTPAPLPRDAAEAGIPLLVIEVLSPSTAKRDREVKTAIYLGAGVEEVWIVDADARSVEIHTGGGVKVFTGSAAATSTAVPEFELVADEIL